MARRSTGNSEVLVKPERLIITQFDEDDAPESEKQRRRRIVRRVDCYVLLPLTFLYFLSFLDRANISYTSVDGLKVDLLLNDSQYLNGLSLFFAGYIIGEFPSVYFLKTLSAPIWLPILTMFWGLVVFANGFMFTVPSYYAARFFLGIAEAGLFPGIIFIISVFYTSSEQPLRIALFFSGASVAGTFGGVLAYGISRISPVGSNGWMNSWRWIFVIEGITTFFIGFLAFRFVPPGDPVNAPFLRDEEDKRWLNNHVSLGGITESDRFEWSGVWSALTDMKCWLYAAILHCLDLPQYTIALFLPSIIQEMGYSAADAQLLTVPPYALAFVVTVSNAYLCQSYGYRAPFIIIPAAIGIIGYVILLAVPTSQSPTVAYLGTFFVLSGVFPSCATVLSWPASNVIGRTKRGTACTLQVFVGFIGAIVGTQVYRNGTESTPNYVLGHSVACGYLALGVVLTMITWIVLTRENERRRDEAGNTSELNHGCNFVNHHAASGSDRTVPNVPTRSRNTSDYCPLQA